MTDEQKVLFTNFYSLTAKQKKDICHMKKSLGMTVDEISRKFSITQPDVNRILSPIKDYGVWTAEEKARHWLAGQKRAQTVKKQRDAKTENEKLRRSQTKTYPN